MIYALVGPTATGKTSLSLSLAEALGAEIVCVDSMLVYRGLDIGTAKPSPAEQARVPHHLVDLVEADDGFSVQQFQAAARAVLADLERRRVPALLVGGSGLYLRAALDPLCFPPTDPEVRAAVEALAPERLAAELATADPISWAAIEPGNIRRMVRALEVHRLTGRPFSAFRNQWATFRPVPLVAVTRPPATHWLIIERRAAAMFEGGLLEETARLRARGPSRTAAAALGYVEAGAVLDGELTLGAGITQVAARTRALARRQRAWFRADPRVAWFSDPTVEGLLAYFRARARSVPRPALARPA